MGVPRKQTASCGSLWEKKYRPPLTPAQAGVAPKTPAVKPEPTRARYFVSYIHSEEGRWGAGNAVLTLNPSSLVRGLNDITAYIEAEYELTKISIINFQKINEDNWLPEPELEVA